MSWNSWIRNLWSKWSSSTGPGIMSVVTLQVMIGGFFFVYKHDLNL